MIFCNKIIITLILLISIIGLAFAIDPTTEPCWVKGTVIGDGITVADLNVDAYLGSSELKSGTIASNGSYSLNSVGANTNDTITMKVYGADFNSFTFEGFCKTGTDPWVVIDFNVYKVANGTTCTNAAICTSGYCDTTCKTTPSSGGNTSGSTGGTSGTGTTSTEPVVTTIVDENNAFTPTASEIRDILENSNLTDAEIADYIEAAEKGELTFKRTLKVVKTTKSGSSTYVSTFTINITNNSGKDLKDIKVVETIPKNIAATASLITSTYQFRVLKEDPVLEFTILSLKAGQSTELTYSVNENVSMNDFDAMIAPVGNFSLAPIEITPDVNATPGENPDTNIVPGTDADLTAIPMDYTMIIIVLVILLIIIGVAYYKKEDIKQMLR